MEARDIAVIVLLVGLAGFAVAYFVVGPGRRRPRPSGDIPLALRPYHADDELEKGALERTMSWGVALVLFSGVFLGAYWLLEPARINQWQDKFYEEDVLRGQLRFAEACSSCHGADAGGGSAPHPDPQIAAPWPAPALNNIVARYEAGDNVADIEQFISDTIKQGRAGTPMPAWGAFYGGAFNDQQIEQIVKYILSIQTGKVDEPQAMVGASGAEIFQASCARCHGQDAEGRVGPGLHDVFARFGGGEAAVLAVRDTIEDGRMVPGALPPMPAWKDQLTPDAIDRLMQYLRSIQKS